MPDPVREAQPAAADTRPPSVYDRIGDIIAEDAFGTGPRASLRRNDPGRVIAQPAFFELMVRVGREVGEGEALVWGAIVHAIAQTATFGHVHPAGRALAEAGLSEARFSRLMAAEGEALRDQIGLAARYLAAKQTSIAWRDLAELMLADFWNDTARADRLRFRIAQTYYRALRQQDQTPSA